MSNVRHYVPLLSFLLPTVVVGYGFVIPSSCIRGLNELSVGFGTTILGATLTYVAGVRSALRTGCPVRAPWRRRLAHYINQQAANPRSLFGRLLALIWTHEHKSVNTAALDLLQIGAMDQVLEIGCGPGWALREASKRAAGGHVLGLDVSETMVSAAGRENRRQIAGGRVSVRLIEGSALGLRPSTLDRAFSVHSIYFWKAPERVVVQLAEALRPGGQVVLAFRPDTATLPARFRDDVYRFYSANEVESMLLAGGFCDIRVVHQPKELVCVVARKAG